MIFDSLNNYLRRSMKYLILFAVLGFVNMTYTLTNLIEYYASHGATIYTELISNLAPVLFMFKNLVVVFIIAYYVYLDVRWFKHVRMESRMNWRNHSLVLLASIMILTGFGVTKLVFPECILCDLIILFAMTTVLSSISLMVKRIVDNYGKIFKN
jgi:hypothetical protein